MLEYAYYPGCSLEHTASPYDKSVREVFKALGIGLKEIDDWNCCGATMYMSVKKIVGYAISARNLAIAQNMNLDVCASCSSCYTILKKTNRHIQWDPKERAKINEALQAANLSYDTIVNIRHPLDILVNDFGLDELKKHVVKPLNGLRVAPYYGCQIVRPHHGFDDIDDPQTMDRLIEVLGGTPTEYSSKVRCCGGMLMTTDEEVALKLNKNLIENAVDNEAEMISTVCPLCQMNVEAYQDKINSFCHTNYNIPIVYFTHLIGIAIGIAPELMGLDKLIVKPEKLFAVEREALI